MSDPAGFDAPDGAGSPRQAGPVGLMLAIILLTGGIAYLHHRSAEPASTTAAHSADVDVYFLGRTGAGQRLFDEHHHQEGVTATDLQAAVTAALGTPDDPDYHPGFAAGTTAVARDTGAVVTIDLHGPGVVDGPARGGDPALALQALVWTADAAVDRSAPVRFTVDGGRARTILGAAARPSYRAEPPAQVLSPVSLTLDEGAQLPRGGLVTGQAAAVEGTVVWRLVQGVRVIRHGIAATARCCRLSPFQLRVDAPPGSYTLEVSDTDPARGEGHGVTTDSKDIQID